MKNFDEKTTLIEARKELMNSLSKGNDEDQKKALDNIFAAIGEEVKAEAAAQVQRVNQDNLDSQVLMSRGDKRVLTSKEKRFFNEVVKNGGFEGLSEAFPTTIVEDILRNLTTEHPILSRVDAVTVSGFMKFIYAKPGATLAFWGDICEDIRQLILQGFQVANLKSFKLSGFVVLCKGMIELGAEWLAEYVIRTLEEIMANSLEYAIVNGEGASKYQPIGMMKSLVGVVDGVYKDKTPIQLTSIDVTSLAGVRAALAKAKSGNGQVALIINPETYYAKVVPSLAATTADGRSVITNLPTDIELIQSYAVPVDKGVIGVLKNYFLGTSSDIKVTEYKETLAIEDLDLYIAKFFGNGTPKDLNAFFVLDLSEVQGAVVPELEAVAEEYPVVGE